LVKPLSGVEFLDSVKKSAHLKRYLVPLPPPAEAYRLAPVSTQAGHLDPEEVRCLTEWRNRHVRAFLTEFRAEEARTGRWLSSVVGPDPTRILFMLEDSRGRKYAYAGIAHIAWGRGYGEADAIVRGESLAKGTMRVALLTLLAWARAELGLRELGVRVLADNPAVEFYRRCGFREVGREGLIRTPSPDGVAWTAASPGVSPVRWLIHMRHEESR
jgi:GNAT superfamily N-acetyltransferase